MARLRRSAFRFTDVLVSSHFMLLHRMRNKSNAKHKKRSSGFKEKKRSVLARNSLKWNVWNARSRNDKQSSNGNG